MFYSVFWLSPCSSSVFQVYFMLPKCLLGSLHVRLGWFIYCHVFFFSFKVTSLCRLFFELEGRQHSNRNSKKQKQREEAEAKNLNPKNLTQIWLPQVSSDWTLVSNKSFAKIPGCAGVGVNACRRIMEESVKWRKKNAKRDKKRRRRKATS